VYNNKILNFYSFLAEGAVEFFFVRRIKVIDSGQLERGCGVDLQEVSVSCECMFCVVNIHFRTNKVRKIDKLYIMLPVALIIVDWCSETAGRITDNK
jgi:hypothetical protein